MKFAYTVIFVENIAATVEFYQRAFAITAKMVTPHFAQMDTGEVTLSFGSNENERREIAGAVEFNENRLDLNPAGIQISFISQDVNADFEKALSAGAKAVVQPQLMPWGQTVSRVRDINGVLVSIVSAPQF